MTVLKIRDFRLTLAARFFDTLGIQMMAVAVGWQIYQLTRDPLLLGFIGLAEAIPYMVFALWAGHIADRREKREIIVGAEVGILMSSLGLMMLAMMRRPPLFPIYVLLGFGGFFRSFQWSAITAYVQLVVPTEIYPKAAAWNSSFWHIAAIAGPALGGVIYAVFGAVAAYGVVAFSFLIAWALVRRLKKIPASTASGESSGPAGFLSGVRFVRSQPVMLAAMSLDMFAVLFGGVVAILPIFADMLKVGSIGLGLLRAAPAAGALLCSLYLTYRSQFRQTGVAFLVSVAAFGTCMVAFAVSRHFMLSLLILAMSGAVDGMSVIIRSSIYQVLTPDPLRGRVSSVNGIFIRSSNEIGAFESGLAAKIMGTVPSVIFGGCMTLICAAIAAWKAPALRRFRLREA